MQNKLRIDSGSTKQPPSTIQKLKEAIFVYGKKTEVRREFLITHKGHVQELAAREAVERNPLSWRDDFGHFSGHLRPQEGHTSAASPLLGRWCCFSLFQFDIGRFIRKLPTASRFRLTRVAKHAKHANVARKFDAEVACWWILLQPTVQWKQLATSWNQNTAVQNATKSSDTT